MYESLKSTFVYVTHDQIEAMTMGTHIVVMNEGIVMQFGAPTEIHDDPKNVFVAKFIGDPGMNIITLPSGMKIGCRPRNVHIITEDIVVNPKEDTILSGTVLATENHGSERLHFVDINLGKIYIKDADRKVLSPGAKLDVVIKPKNIYVFDSEEQRVYDEEGVKAVYGEFKRLGN